MPGIGGLLFGQRLAAVREAAGVTRLEAAREVGDKTDIRIRHWEAGRRLPKFEVVALLGRRYGLDEAAINGLQVMREEANTPSRWGSYGLPESAVTYLGLEDDAAEICTNDGMIVPGLLQAEAYMRRLFAVAGVDGGAVNNRVAARLLRQEHLTVVGKDEPLRLTTVISEAVLRWVAHEPKEVAVQQLEHLLDRAQWSNVEIRVLPFDAGLHPGMDGPFSLLRFPKGLLKDLAYVESASGGHLIDECPTVTRLDTLFHDLHSQALPPEESLAIIAQVADETR